MVSRILIGSVLSIVYLSPWCQWYSLGVSIVYLSPLCQWYSMGMYCQSSIYLHGFMATQWWCLVNRLIISMVSMVLIGSVLSIVYLPPWCQWYSLGVYCQSSNYLHGVNGTHWECLVNRLIISMVSMVLIGSVLLIVYLSPWCQWYLLGVSCESSIYLHGVNGTH